MSIATDKSAYILGVEYNLLSDEETFYEHWEIESDDHVMRLAQIKSSTNCLVKYNPDELVPPE